MLRMRWRISPHQCAVRVQAHHIANLSTSTNHALSDHNVEPNSDANRLP